MCVFRISNRLRLDKRRDRDPLWSASYTFSRCPSPSPWLCTYIIRVLNLPTLADIAGVARFSKQISHHRRHYFWLCGLPFFTGAGINLTVPARRTRNVTVFRIPCLSSDFLFDSLLLLALCVTPTKTRRVCFVFFFF